jgi:uncharacterized peroxidase-related enzyme
MLSSMPLLRGLEMRLAILNSGHRIGTKILFALIRAISRQPVPEVLKLVTYRPDFFGSHLKTLTHEAMRGPSEWTVGERELMAAFVSKMNDCEFCIRAHTAVASRAYRDSARVSAVLSNLETSEIREPLRVTLRMLGKLTREYGLEVEDVREVLAAGVSPEQIVDALAVSLAFNMMNCLADAFEFSIAGPEVFDAGAKYLLARGYR